LPESESLGDNLLALLGKLQNKPAAVRRVMHKIARLPKQKRADTLEKLAILVGLRPTELPELIQKEATMPISVDLEKNPLFMEIFERYTKVGEQRGEQSGKTMMLRRLLEKRFGDLPPWVNARLEQARLPELEQWSLQLLDAACLEDVFNLHE
jgi:hypothetical protein